jgi:hypothetical protein
VVEQVSLVQGDLLAQVLDPVELLRRGAPHDPVDGVALLQEQLGQVGAVLPGDAADECRWNAVEPSTPLADLAGVG